MYTKNSTQFSLSQIRAEHPNMSIPDGADLSDIGYLTIEPTPRPTPGAGEIVTAGEPEEYESGKWRETWVIQPAPPAPIPQVVSRFQARAALHLAGLLPQVEQLMADPATDPLARIAWQDAQEFRRTSPTVLTMAAALGLTDAQLDDLFTTAAGIAA
jgi:hypothetical protein